MKLTDTTIEIRPRNAWEAIDLGILLAHRHSLLLISTWLITTLPLFCLLTLVFWNIALPITINNHTLFIPIIPLLILWWLKPIFDRIPLYILSNAVFGQTPTLKNTLRYWLKSLKSNVLADLTIRRFRLSRSFELPVSQLEMYTGSARKQRLRNLHLANNRAGLLTLLFMHIEGILFTAFIAFIFMFATTPNLFPSLIDESIKPALLEQIPFWKVHTYSLLYILILTITEPIYVSCGFCLYLNRRINMDAWDIELAFKRLSTRLTKFLSIIFISGCLSLIIGYTDTVQAETLNPSKPTNIQQERAISKQKIDQITNSAPFFVEKKKTLLRWKNTPDLSSSNNSLSWISFDFIKIFLWATVIFAVLLIIWQLFKHYYPANRKLATDILPKELFGLAITPESLPNNLTEEFDSLWQQNQTRQALSLLYRALLSHLVHNYQIPIKSSHTEGEIVYLTEHIQLPKITEFTKYLTNQWLQIAYGHSSIQPEQKQLLITGWQTITQENNNGAKS